MPTDKEINEARKLNHSRIDLALKCLRQETTIRRLVEVIDQLRQPYNNSKRHDLYEYATSTLNDLEEREELPR